MHGFDTRHFACFIATRAELRAVLPGWRVPLPAPVRRTVPNPFTGEPVLVYTRDPGPDLAAPVPPRLPFEHALLPNEEDWESRYLALDLSLSGLPGAAPSHFTDAEGLHGALSERGLTVSALLGGDSCEDPRWVYGVPSRLIVALNALALDSLEVELGRWNARSPSRSELADLNDLWTMAQRATAQAREMFLWVDAPPHRCSVHHPHRQLPGQRRLVSTTTKPRCPPARAGRLPGRGRWPADH